MMEYHGRLQQFNAMPTITPDEMHAVARSSDFQSTHTLINETYSELAEILCSDKEKATGSWGDIIVELMELKDFYEFSELYNNKRVGVLTDTTPLKDSAATLEKPELKPFNALIHSSTSLRDHVRQYGALPAMLYYDTESYEKLPNTITVHKLYSQHIAKPSVWERENLKKSIARLNELMDHDDIRGELKLLPVVSNLKQMLALMNSGAVGEIVNTSPVAVLSQLN